jgi:hypothetical protein
VQTQFRGHPIAGSSVDESKQPPPDKSADDIAEIDTAGGKLAATYRGVSSPDRAAVSPGGSGCILAEKAAHLYDARAS